MIENILRCELSCYNILLSITFKTRFIIKCNFIRNLCFFNIRIVMYRIRTRCILKRISSIFFVKFKETFTNINRTSYCSFITRSSSAGINTNIILFILCKIIEFIELIQTGSYCSKSNFKFVIIYSVDICFVKSNRVLCFSKCFNYIAGFVKYSYSNITLT